MSLRKKVEEAKMVIGKPMNMGEFSDDVEQLLMKYASGTGVDKLTVEEFKWLNALICDIIRKPQEVLDN